MKNGSTGFRALLLFTLLSLFRCAGHDAANGLQTWKTFEGEYDLVWRAALSVVKEQTQMPVKAASMSEGFLASDWVEEERTLHNKDANTYSRVPSRYRVNLSFRRVPAPNKPPGIERITITVSKQMELKNGNKWRGFPSDHQTESAIIAAIGRELGEQGEKR